MPSQEKIFNTRGEADFERPRVGTSEGGRGNFWNQAGGTRPQRTLWVIGRMIQKHEKLKFSLKWAIF